MDRAHDLADTRWPEADASGEFGGRVLRLLAIQVDRNLDDLGERGSGALMATITPPEPRYSHYFLGSNALALAVLATAGPGEAWPGVTSEELLDTSVACLRTLVATHPLGGGTEEWSAFSAGRFMYHLATSALLLGDALPARSRDLAGRILAAEADRFLGGPAPAQLRDDTQAESNAWHGGGLAAVACALPRHPRRADWEEKALEYMISAYATEGDVAGDRVVDGRPLREWLTGPNALDDHTVENHGFVHADYMAAVSEMVRAAIPYALVGRAIPDAVTFNAGEVFDRLVALSLPDTTHLYVQGTDYTARRIDSLWQACIVALVQPTPLRTAVLMRSLERMERMAEQWPALPMTGWLGLPHDLGATWGLSQNYLAARLFGVKDEAVPDEDIERRLAGTHVSAQGQFVVQRTPRSITTFSCHSDAERAHVLGLSMPLDRDTLCYPMQGSWFGDVALAGPSGEEAEGAPGPCALRWRDGADAVVKLQRCGARITQHCAFIPLDEGGAVFLSELQADDDLTLARATAGTVWLFDDLRWPWQDAPRVLVGATGTLEADGTPHATGWVNVDDRLGWAAVGAARCVVRAVPGNPTIFRTDVPVYDTTRIDFIPDDLPASGAIALRAGERRCRFAMIVRPDQRADETRALAEEMSAGGWLSEAPGVLAFRAGDRVLFASFTAGAAHVAGARVEPWTCGVLPA